jgi:hypothetical protein
MGPRDFDLQCCSFPPLVRCLVGWFVGWLIGWLVGWLLVGWLVGCWVGWLVSLGRLLLAIGCEVREIRRLFCVSRRNLLTFCGRTISRGCLRTALWEENSLWTCKRKYNMLFKKTAYRIASQFVPSDSVLVQALSGRAVFTDARFDPRRACEGFVVDFVALGYVLLCLPRRFLLTIVPPLLHTKLSVFHLSNRHGR